MSIKAVIDELSELKNSRLARIHELQHIKADTEKEIADLKGQLKEIQGSKDSLDSSEIEAQIKKENELNTALEVDTRKIDTIDKQLAYEKEEKNYLDFQDYSKYQNDLESEYDTVKADVYLKVQNLSEQIVQAGEELVAARNEANKGMNIIFDLYHGNTIFEDKPIRVCVGDHTVIMDNGHRKTVNDFEDRIDHHEYRSKHTIGTDQDVTPMVKVSEIFNNRGNYAWWNKK